jgi:Zn finger protein HypA/HybF involved in hydrogenase expression
MHEVAIAQSLFQVVADSAARHGIRKVQAVGVCIGQHSGVAAGALALAFEVLREGPLLAGASLEVRSVEGTELRLEWIEGE